MRRFALFVRYVAYGLFTITSLAVAAYAFTFLYRTFDVDNPFAAQFAVSGLDVPLHFFAAGLALALGPLQLNGAVRRRWPALHRTSGWLYVVAIVIGAGSALSLSFHTQGGWASGSSFAVLAILWLLVTARGVWFAVSRDYVRHRQWMCRSVALTFAAVTLRIIIGVGTGVLELPFLAVYITAAWACWTINLAGCELILRWPAIRAHRARGVAGRRLASRPVSA